MNLRRLVLAFLVLFALSISALGAFALDPTKEIKDVTRSYWAYTEIVDVLNEGIMKLDAQNDFNPEMMVKRTDFVEALVMTLGQEDLKITTKNKFKDINSKTRGYSDILRSDQLGLVYGYPNKKFRPTRVMTKAEAMSVISHITNDKKADLTVLDKFNDKYAIPKWAIDCHAKSISYNVYVAYPNPSELLPNKDLTRAEMAVLLHKLRNAMGMVQEKYKGDRVKENSTKAEHLNVSKQATNNTVLITNLRKIIQAGNILEVAFKEDFYSKRSFVDGMVEFVVKEDVLTEEGTLVFPKETIMRARIQELTDPKWMNVNAKVRLIFTEYQMPDKIAGTMEAVIWNDKAGILTENRWQKPAIYTLVNAATSTGTAIGIAAIPTEKKWGEAVAIGLPVGAGVGLVAGIITPGVNYKGNEGENVLIKLTQDLSIYHN